MPIFELTELVATPKPCSASAMKLTVPWPPPLTIRLTMSVQACVPTESPPNSVPVAATVSSLATCRALAAKFVVAL